MSEKISKVNKNYELFHNESVVNNSEILSKSNTYRFVSFRIKSNEYEKLQKIANELEVSVSAVLRRAVKEFLRRWENAEGKE